MQEKILKYFIELTKIPHCSRDTDKLMFFLKDFALSRGYSVEIDKAKNILAKRGKPKLALQAHYDMVCIGEAPKIETYVKNRWLKARNSSLGADNGIGIAMMMFLMDTQMEVELLFTSDEEIGLIGASQMSFELESSNILNVDFEDEAEVCIGCAGGADLIAQKSLEEGKKLIYNYKVSVQNLAGGHSGLDIDKGIPNAIQVLAQYLQNKDILLSSFIGGERRNSIPANASAIVSSNTPLESQGLVGVEPLNGEFKFYKAQNLLEFLAKFQHGVDSYNEELNIPNTSINLAKIDFQNGDLTLELSVRAMDSEGFKEILSKNIKLFQKYGFVVRDETRYPAWQPEINSFTETVLKSMKKIFGKSKYKAIHAGLECGILSQRYPNIKFASIGSTIISPHSLHESAKLDSIEQTLKVILEIINSYDNE